jgi:hypothetical protein
MKGLLAAFLFLVAANAAWAESVDLGSVLATLPSAPSGREGIAGRLWVLADDEEFALRFAESVDERHLVLADSLLSLLRMSEPTLRELLPDMYTISDFGPPPGERDPDWARVRWAGIRWMRRIVEFAPDGRDARLRQELDAAMLRVDRPQRAEMGGVVEILVEWWADRGLDPALTHHRPPRDPAVRALSVIADGGPRPGLELLLAMDRDVVVRERVLRRLSVEETAWLARDFMLALEIEADSLRALGVPERAWDPETGTMQGHTVLALRRLALAALDQTAPPVVAGPDDLTRRLARLAWWDDARFEARYWSDPRRAPDFSPFLTGLAIPTDQGGRDVMTWVRMIHLQSPGTQRRILEQLGVAQRPVVAELLGLAELERDEAAGAGFRMVYRRRPITRAEGTREVSVAIDWRQVVALVRSMLAAITGERPPAVLARAPESLGAWWADWWANERDDERWYRGPLPPHLELPDTGRRPEFEPGRGRVD